MNCSQVDWETTKATHGRSSTRRSCSRSTTAARRYLMSRPTARSTRTAIGTPSAIARTSTPATAARQLTFPARCRPTRRTPEPSSVSWMDAGRSSKRKACTRSTGAATRSPRMAARSASTSRPHPHDPSRGRSGSRPPTAARRSRRTAPPSISRSSAGRSTARGQGAVDRFRPLPPRAKRGTRFERGDGDRRLDLCGRADIRGSGRR